MINFIQRLSKNTFVKVSGINGIITIAKSAIFVISNKIMATIIGASGIAMIGQLQNFIAISTMLSSGGFNQGLTKYIAENKANRKELSEFIGTAFIITSTLTSLIAFGILIFSRSISLKLFNNGSYFSILVIFAFTMLFYNLNSLVSAIVNGFQQYRLYFIINISTTLVGFCLTIGLVLTLREYGALLALVLGQSIIFFIAYYFIRNEYWLLAFKYHLFTQKKMQLLLKYTTVTVFAAIIWPVVNIVIRTYVINNISTHEAGIWQATRNINDYIVTIAIGSFSVYLLPKLSSITDKKLLRKELTNIYKVIIPFTLIGFLLVYLLRDLIVILLYSKEFLKVSDYLLFQMFGSFFWMCKVPIMNYMLAKGYTKTYLFNEISFAILYIILCAFFIPLYKVQGIQLAFAIYNFLYLLLNIHLIIRYLR